MLKSPIIESNEDNCKFDYGQKWLISRMQSLGYQADSDGICFGLAYMAMHALLLNEIEHFNKRLESIANIPIDEFSEKVKKVYQQQNFNNNILIDNNLSSELSDVLSFFDGIELYFNSYEYPFLFEKAPNSQNAFAVIPIVLPEKLEKKGGIITTSRISGIYTREGLEVYFSTFRQTLEEQHISHPIVFILNSGDHTMTVSYDAINKCWRGVDPERMPAEILISDIEIADMVMGAFTENDICTFFVDVFATQDFGQVNLDQLILKWQNHPACKDLHDLNKPIVLEQWQDDSDNDEVLQNHIQKYQAVDFQDYSLLYTVVSANDLKSVLSLLEFDVNVNQQCIDGYTPLLIAVQDSSIEVISTLVDHEKININQANDKGCTPLMASIQRGQIDIIKKILTHENIDLHCKNKIGHNALIIAILSGRFDIVHELILKKVETNCETHGLSPVFFAARNGHVDIVQLLLENNAEVDIESLIIAAKNGNAEIVKILLHHQKQLNTSLMRYRIHCAVIAAVSASYDKYNHEVIDLFIGASDDLALSDNMFNYSLKLAIENDNQPAFTKILEWAKSRNIKYDCSLTRSNQSLNSPKVKQVITKNPNSMNRLFTSKLSIPPSECQNHFIIDSPK